MARLKEFRFFWADAWYQIDYGYDTILQTSDDGGVYIKVMVNMKPYEICLTDREDEFINSLEELKIHNWNKKLYVDTWVVDGCVWELSLTYDSQHILARGINGYPFNFLQFLKLFHEKYKVPRATIEDVRCVKDGMKHTEIEEITFPYYTTYH